MTEIAYQDQYDAAVAETSSIMSKIATTESRTYTAQEGWPPLVTQSVARLSSKPPIFCEHISSLGPRLHIIYISHAMYAYCMPCGTTGDALKIRQAETKFQEHCYYCGKRTKTFQSWGFTYKNLLLVGDACLPCAKKSGIT